MKRCWICRCKVYSSKLSFQRRWRLCIKCYIKIKKTGHDKVIYPS